MYNLGLLLWYLNSFFCFQLSDTVKYVTHMWAFTFMSEVNGFNKMANTHLQNESEWSKTHAKFILDWYTLQYNPNLVFLNLRCSLIYE